MKINSGYMSRALQSEDPRYARILRKLGYESDQPDPEDEEELEEVKPKKTKRGYNRRDMRAKDE